MTSAQIVDRYYETANAGEWDAWCDLFTDDMVMDEQLAGHIEGLATLRPMMAGMGRAYSRFQNVPRHVIVLGDEAAVVSHISAANAAGTMDCTFLKITFIRRLWIRILARLCQMGPRASWC